MCLNKIITPLILIVFVVYVPNIFAQFEPRATLSGHNSSAYDLTFNHSGTILATVGLDMTVRLWETKTGSEIAVLRNHNRLESVAINPKGNVLVCGDQEGNIIVWNIWKYEHVKTMKGHDSVVRTFDFSHSGKMVASGEWGWRKTLKIWNTRTWKVIHGINAGRVEDVAFSTDDSIIASGSLEDGTVKVWDTETGELMQDFKTGMARVFGVEFLYNEHKLLVSGEEGLQMWDVVSGNRLHTFSKREQPSIRSLHSILMDNSLQAELIKETFTYGM